MAKITCTNGMNLSTEDINRLLVEIDADGTIRMTNVAETFKAHRTTAQTTTTASAWTDCDTLTEVADETVGTVAELNADNKTIDILVDGVYQFGGCVHFQNNSGGDKEPLVASRLFLNATTELRCSQRAQKLTVKDGGESTLSYNGTASLEAGDSITLQYYLSDNSIDFASNTVFENPVAYTIWLTRIGKAE